MLRPAPRRAVVLGVILGALLACGGRSQGDDCLGGRQGSSFCDPDGGEGPPPTLGNAPPPPAPPPLCTPVTSVRSSRVECPAPLAEATSSVGQSCVEAT
ncbi:MAG TPA: hypothetical protein VLT33_02980, partial [Labilithrix sp.]|nr:hypothetical protein [Labilithrix sp.]